MKHTFLIVCCLMIMTTATAQQNVQKHELSIYGLGGYSPIGYTLDANGSKKSVTGGGAGLGYTININPSLGIVTGIEMSTYGAEISFENIQGDYSEGTNTDLFQFSYSLKNYKETQSITMFSVPIMAQYSLPLGKGSTKFYASGGFKLGFPIVAKTDITPGTVTTSGYYAHEKITYANLPQHGFVSNVEFPTVKKDLELGFSAALALETGIRFTLSDKIFLYTGVYFDYGLNNIQKINDKHLLEYDASNETTYKYNSILNTNSIDKINLLSAGLKLRISFAL